MIIRDNRLTSQPSIVANQVYTGKQLTAHQPEGLTDRVILSSAALRSPYSPPMAKMYGIFPPKPDEGFPFPPRHRKPHNEAMPMYGVIFPREPGVAVPMYGVVFPREPGVARAMYGVFW